MREGPAFRLAMRLVVTADATVVAADASACRRAGVRPWTGVAAALAAVADAGAVAAGAAVDDADAAAGAGSKRSSSCCVKKIMRKGKRSLG